MPTASDLCDQSVTVAQVGDETSSGTCPIVYYTQLYRNR
jgi:hypothetical protein